MCNFVFQETDAFSEMYNYSIKKKPISLSSLAKTCHCNWDYALECVGNRIQLTCRIMLCQCKRHLLTFLLILVILET